ncbi:MAG: EamA family transporter [Synechocystis sp.]|nr:EamA family transporter [Synechocystis sp.]
MQELKTIALLVTMVTTQVLGDIWLSQGMKVHGAVTDYSLGALWGLFLYLLTSPWIVLGVATLIFSLFLYFTATSRLDLSLVLPLFSSSYILNALLAWVMLGEQVSSYRWLGTLMIASGVFIVAWSESRARLRRRRATPPAPVTPPRSPVESGRSPFWLFPVGVALSASKVWLGILILIFTDSAGDVLIARGMKQIGPVTLQSPRKMLALIGRILSHPSVLSGISCQTVSFVTFISLLSWTDISLIRPAGALGYVMSLLGAKFWLKERIPLARWLGIAIIATGVALIALDEANLVGILLPFTR